MGKHGALMKDNPLRTERDRTIAVERLKGKTYRELSEQFGLSKSSLHHILSDDEMRDVIETGTREITGLIPKAVGNYEKLLDSEDEKIRLKASQDVLQTTGIMPSHTQSNIMVNILNKTDIIITKEIEQLSRFLQSQLEDVIDIMPEDDPEADQKEA
jgi:DNA-binding Xre family transcriptional regulator